MINTTRLSALALGLAFAAGSWADVPFKVTKVTADGKFDPSTVWYTMTIGTGNIRISNNKGADFISLTGKLSPADENLWCFVGDEANGYQIYNKETGTSMVLTAPVDMSESEGGTAYAVLKDATLTDAAYSNRWDFKEAKMTSGNQSISVENGWYVNQHSLTANILNNRQGKLAFWSAGFDNGSAIVVSEAGKTFEVNMANGKFTATNAAGSYASAWASTATDPTLRLTTGANNMSKHGDSDFNLASGGTKSSTYNLTAGSGYLVTGYSFTFQNEKANANALKFVVGDKEYNVTNEPQTITVSNLTEATAQFTLTGDNHNVTVTNFTVNVCVSFAAGEKQTDLFVTDGSKPAPYRIPAIAKAHNGDLIAVSDYRPCGSDIGYGRVDLMGRISKDNGQTWGEEFVIKSGTGTKGAIDCGFGDAALVADSESDEVLLISVCGNTPYPNATRSNPNPVARFRSHDNGKTWSDFENITESIYTLFDDSKLGAVNGLFFGSGRICQSRLVKVGKYYRLYAALTARPNGNRVIYSDDFGETWHALGCLTVSPAPAGDEPKCEELPDGTVILSSRMNGGRFYNLFTYTDVEKAEGSWGTVATSNADNKGTIATGNSTNGEILIIPAIRNKDKAEVYVALQSVPFGSGRANVGIYYKELSSPDDVKSPAAFAANWDGKHQASKLGSAYSTMIMQANDSIAFFYEEETYGRAYTNVYKQYSLEGLTGGAYTYNKHQSPASFVKKQLERKLEAATKDLEYGIAVGEMDKSRQSATEQQFKQLVADYVNNPTPQEYIDAQKRITETIENGRVQVVNGHAYTLLNKQRTGKYLNPSETVNTKEGKITFGGADADYESARQQFVFESTGKDGEWYILNKATQTYLSATKATTKLFVTQETDKANAGTYVVKPYKQGWSNVVCTNPAVTNYIALNLNANFQLIQSTATPDAARWRVVPAEYFVEGIGEVETTTEQKEVTLYDLQGRVIKRAPRTGVYISSDHRKHVAH